MLDCDRGHGGNPLHFGGSKGGGITARFMGTNIFGIMISLPLVLVLTCLLTGVPAAITIWLGERFQIRSLLFYCWAGAVIGALIQTLLFRSFSPLGWLFVLAGFLAGFDYWFVAGKHAGQEGSFSSNMP
jgi:hypothetical protein